MDLLPDNYIVINVTDVYKGVFDKARYFEILPCIDNNDNCNNDKKSDDPENDVIYEYNDIDDYNYDDDEKNGDFTDNDVICAGGCRGVNAYGATRSVRLGL